jgi:hypothetical protein
VTTWRMVKCDNVEDGNNHNNHQNTNIIKQGNIGKSQNILIVDTGGGNMSTITKHACLVFAMTNHIMELLGIKTRHHLKGYLLFIVLLKHISKLGTAGDIFAQLCYIVGRQ